MGVRKDAGKSKGKSGLMSRYYSNLLPVGLAGFLYLWEYLSGFTTRLSFPHPVSYWNGAWNSLTSHSSLCISLLPWEKQAGFAWER